jgi:phenylacetate-CoA ligase
MTPWKELVTLPTLFRRSRKSIETYQNLKLRNLVKQVYATNSFYRRLWDEAGVDPRKFRGTEDLHRIPPVTKLQLRELAAITKRNPPSGERVIWFETSGSSGEPSLVAHTWSEARFLALIYTMAARGMGFRARYRQARITVPLDSEWIDDRPLRLLNRLGLFRSEIFSCYQTPEELYRQLSAYQPDLIMGYSETVARVARHGLESGLCAIRPKLVIVGGEVCTPMMRRQIADAFQAPVREIYASTEVNLIGWTCPQTGLLHLYDPAVLVEVLDGQGKPVADGETGTVVVTGLHTRLMPFVRFVLGDRVVKGPSPCTCGAPFGTLRSVNGREIDRLELRNGETLHAYELLEVLLEAGLKWIRQYRLVQEEPGVIEAHVWPLRPPAQGEMAELEARLRKEARGAEIRIKLVDKMELDPSGKFRLSCCSVHANKKSRNTPDDIPPKTS